MSYNQWWRIRKFLEEINKNLFHFFPITFLAIIICDNIIHLLSYIKLDFPQFLFFYSLSFSLFVCNGRITCEEENKINFFRNENFTCFLRTHHCVSESAWRNGTIWHIMYKQWLYPTSYWSSRIKHYSSANIDGKRCVSLSDKMSVTKLLHVLYGALS